MRVTGGQIRGSELKVLPGHLTRPTTNVARQAIFSILENSAAGWERALDLYAGTGALGIEALSRNAEWVDFVDSRKKCCDIMKYNLGKMRISHKAHIYCCSVKKAITFLSNNYGIIFIDPPYSDPSTNDLLDKLSKSSLVGENSTIVVCHANRFPLNPDYDRLHLVTERRYGDTFISIYQN